MYAQCPGCYSIYRMDAATLSQARGQVRCGICELLFNALPTLRDDLPPPGTEPVAGENAELAFEFAEPAPAESGGLAQGTTDERFGDPDGFYPADESRASPPGRDGWLWAAGCAILGALGVIQIFLWAPPALANYPGLRPVAQVLCSFSGCALEPRRDLDRIRLASRDVRAHPSVSEALIVSATLVNTAEFTQAYPLLELRLSDLDGRLVALRRFAPAGYLPDDVKWRDGMAPDSRVRVALELVDPGAGAVSFEFVFRSSQSTSG